MKRALPVAALAAAALLLLAPGASVYYESGGGENCARCHEIRPTFETWLASSHRNVKCSACHGDALTLSPAFHLNNLHRVVQHARGGVPEQIRLREADLPAMLERCRACHRQEFADWQSGPHGATYGKFFLDEKHNSTRLLADDCLRCHGAHYQGGVRDLVEPVSTRGPWRMKNASMAGMPAIPCMSCHQVHREGAPLQKGAREVNRPSLALYDRRERGYFGVAALPLPAVREGERPLQMSRDRRQALCYQCHAPLATAQAGYGDDRTGMGVHEGISCLACHQKHGQRTQASCAGCHPRLSNCGLDVEKMDTTYVSAKSAHNIHFAKCIDCHTGGVPQKRRQSGVRAAF